MKSQNIQLNSLKSKETEIESLKNQVKKLVFDK